MQKLAVFGLLVVVLGAAPAAAQRRMEPVVTAPRVLLMPQPGHTTVGDSPGLPTLPGPHGEIADATVLSARGLAAARAARPPVARYRLVGALAGAALGMVGYYLTGYQDDYCRDDDLMSCDIGFAVYGAVGAAAGGLAGHLIGTFAPPSYLEHGSR